MSQRQMRQIASFLRGHVPVFESSYVVQSGVHVGARETRRITGEYMLTPEDVLGARKFPDAIARCAYSIDINSPTGSDTELKHLAFGEPYDIPLRRLVPQRVDRPLVAGRCISGSHEAHSSYRVMPIAMAMGQAAAVCAALSARSRRSPRDVSAAEVQHGLRSQGASLRPAA